MPHLWALPIIKHKVHVIMDFNICRLQGVGVGRFLHLLLKSRIDLTPINKDIFLPILKEAWGTMVPPLFYKEYSWGRCPPNTLRNFLFVLYLGGTTFGGIFLIFCNVPWHRWGLILHMSLWQLVHVIQNPMNSFHTMEIMKCILSGLELSREVRIKHVERPLHILIHHKLTLSENILNFFGIQPQTLLTRVTLKVSPPTRLSPTYQLVVLGPFSYHTRFLLCTIGAIIPKGNPF